ANPEQELQSGLSLLGHIDEKFINICPIMAPTTDGIKEKAIISRGYDATTHFESTVRDVLDMYRRVKTVFILFPADVLAALLSLPFLSLFFNIFSE
ncbi:hypothetical protein, partial [Pseudomonas aeruginosa]|uniref:hypothetical protein n=1 Tax=Pseudomonas aeruginosa TaxID=287 RepID=UPI0013C41D73